MGFKEGFTVRNAQGQPALSYIQASRDTFIENRARQRESQGRTQSLRLARHRLEGIRRRVEAARRARSTRFGNGLTIRWLRMRPIRLVVRIEMFQFGPGFSAGQGDRGLEIVVVPGPRSPVPGLWSGIVAIATLPWALARQRSIT
jgi:hypothetical protein